MGRGLFDEVPEYAAVEREADALVGYSIRDVCLNDTGNRLNRTLYTQPCLYVVSALHCYKALAAGERPGFLAGHSLGEYDALLAAGAFDFLTGLRLVQKRGELMAAVRSGGMAAVVGLPAEQIPRILEKSRLLSIDVANFNSPQQTVISGPIEDIQRAESAFESAGAQMYVELPVSAAFHSRYLLPVAEAFDRFLASFTFARLRTPVIANATGKPYPEDNPTRNVRELLVRQITYPVLWMQSVRYLCSSGVRDFKEVGSGTMLTDLIRQITAH